MGNPLKATYDPANPPAVGHTLVDSGFTYTVKGVKPHRNLKGEASLVITWEGLCAEDGAPFELKTGAKVYSLARRCKAHNIGWVKAYPYGAPRPANAPTAGGVNTANTIKAFADRFGDWIDSDAGPRDKDAANKSYELMLDYLEIEFPDLLA